MMYQVILIAHVLVAFTTGIASSYALVALWLRNESVYRTVAALIAFLATFEILSGTALSVLSSEVTTLSLCSNIAIYLSVVAATELLLYVRMKKISMSFPLIKIISPTATSLLLFVSAIAYGF